MRALVTGGTGKIGQRVVRQLSRQFELRLLLRPGRQPPACGVEVFTGDLLDDSTLTQAVNGIDAVVHLAAHFRDATAEQMDVVNRQGSLALARYAASAGARRFVFASTSLVYKRDLGKPASEYDATGPDPQFRYPATKLAAENILLDLSRERGFGLHILRLAFVYGDGDPHLAEWMPRLRKQPGNALFQLVHHADVARAVELSLLASGSQTRVYNVTDVETLKVCEVQQLLGVDCASPEQSGLTEAQRWSGIMESRRIREELGFKRQVGSLRDAIARGAL